ncbi:hypothetical protein ACLOJK_029710, partial [Asimina triloba]
TAWLIGGPSWLDLVQVGCWLRMGGQAPDVCMCGAGSRLQLLGCCFVDVAGQIWLEGGADGFGTGERTELLDSSVGRLAVTALVWASGHGRWLVWSWVIGHCWPSDGEMGFNPSGSAAGGADWIFKQRDLLHVELHGLTCFESAWPTWRTVWGVLAAAQMVSCYPVRRGIRSDEGGELLAVDGRTVGAIWGRCPSLSRRRRAAWPLAAAGDGGVSRSKEMQMGWIGEDDGAPYWCSVLRRTDAVNKVSRIHERLLAAQSRQKSYTDVRRRDLEFK